MAKILLTGATGFVGSHLLKTFLNAGHQIVAAKRSYSNVKRIKKYLDNTNLECVNIDEIDIDKIFEKNNIEIIVHCATDYGHKNGNVVNILESNLMLPVKILQAAEKYNVTAFINTDSYFNKQENIYSFLSYYCLSKRNFVQWLHQYSTKIKIANVIIEHAYGENDNPYKFVEDAIKKIAILGAKKYNATLGEQVRDFVYIKDVANAYLKIIDDALFSDFSYKTFNIGTGVGTKLKDFLEMIKNISTSNTEINFGAIPYREAEIMNSVADTTTLNDLGWKSKYKLADGLHTIIDYYKKEIKCQQKIN